MRKDDNHWDAVGKNNWRTDQEKETSTIESIVLQAVRNGAMRSGDILTAAQQLGLSSHHKNIFPVLERLERDGLIYKKYATRPINWLPKEQSKVIPEEQLPSPLMLMMGYTSIVPVGAKKVSPLEIYEDIGYEKMPNNAIGTKRREIHIGCSMKGFENMRGD
jgi:hypothetical protein